MAPIHNCQRQPCGCEEHTTHEQGEDGEAVDGTQRRWSVACKAHGGWLPTTLTTTLPPPSELQLQLHLLREREQILIDQLETLQDEILHIEERLTSRKRMRS